MVDRGADDRQAKSDVHAGQLGPFPSRGIDFETEQLDGNVALVVIDGDNSIILPGPELDENSIAGNRPDDIKAIGDRSGDCWCRDVDVLATEQSALAGMRIEG